MTARRNGGPCDIPLPIRRRVISLESHSGMRREKACVLYPRTAADLHAIFAFARGAGRRLTLRGGGHAFHDQALCDDLAVSMKHIAAPPTVTLSSGPTVTVAAGTTWGRIVSALNRQKAVMPGTVTSSHATAGGTLAADCLSRFSPLFGKEGDQVQSFTLITPDGREDTYCPPAGDLRSRDARTFVGAIGGFGYLGAFMEITYDVLPASVANMNVRTTARRLANFSDLSSCLIPDASSVPSSADQASASWATLYLRGFGDEASLILESQFTPDRGRRHFPLYGGPLRTPSQLAPLAATNRGLRAWFDHFRRERSYIDSIRDFSFFMDANTEARRIDWRSQIQQTFFLPCGRYPQERLEGWLREAEQVLRDHHASPMLTDIGYLPQDKHPFYLSPNAKSPGFAVSYAFVGGQRMLHRARSAMFALSDILAEAPFGGRVSLVKNVYAQPTTLEKMYKTDVERFFRLKRAVDPHGTLRNEFLERCFPHQCQAAGWLGSG